VNSSSIAITTAARMQCSACTCIRLVQFANDDYQ
jgi:hypothetical protein